MITRRRALFCLGGLIAAPAVIKAERLMKIARPLVVRPLEFNTEDLIFRATERYAIGWDDWRAVFGITGF